MSAAPARATAALNGLRARAAAVEMPARPRLRVVAPLPFKAPRGPFVLVVGSLLTLGLLGGLGLNMLVAQDAFALGDLRKESALLADREQALLEEVAIAEGPGELESRARALGMVSSVNPVFLRLADGAVLGKTEAPRAPAVRPPTADELAAAEAAAAAAAAEAATTTSTTTNTDDGGGTVGPVTDDGDGELFDPQAVRTKKAAAR